MTDTAEELVPTNEDYSAALRLSRKHIYGGHEPYAPAIASFARMLAEHRQEVRKQAFHELLHMMHIDGNVCDEKTNEPLSTDELDRRLRAAISFLEKGH